MVGCSARTPAPPSSDIEPEQVSPQADSKEKIVLSLVWLTGPGPLISKDELTARLRKAFGDENFSLTYAGATSFLKRGDWRFQIHQYQEPYFDKQAFDFQQIGDMRLRQALQEHSGWVAVDATQWPQNIEPEEGYKTVGKIVAELATGRDSKALYLPAIEQFLPYQPQLLDDLRSDPLAAFEKSYGL